SAQVVFSGLRFHLVERLDKAQSYGSSFFVIGECIMELPARMRPAAQMGYLLSHANLVIGCIAIRLQIAFKPVQYMAGSPGAAPALIIEQHCSIEGTMVNPIVSLMAFALFVGILYPDRCFIGLQIAFGFGF